jgi:hypothetical protein
MRSDTPWRGFFGSSDKRHNYDTFMTPGYLERQYFLYLDDLTRE